MEAGTQINVKVYSYKSVRIYGGREITTTFEIVPALFVKDQRDHTHVVELIQDCKSYKKGHVIAVQPKDFNV